MKKNPLLAPVVKWVGGKRQLLSSLLPLVPEKYGTYCEPFLGGGAMFFSLQPEKAKVNDLNSELVNLYEIIRDDVKGLIAELETHPYEPDYFYYLRNLDRDKDAYAGLSQLQRAARLLYLNRTCYNGLYRVNSKGEFNTPFGKYKNPIIANSPALLAVNAYLNQADIRFSSADYAAVLKGLPKNSFVYLDPPYDPLSETASFTSYAKNGFDRNEQERLRDCCLDLNRRGISFMLSNSATDFIKDLYEHKDFNITIVQAKRAVNSVAGGRGAIDEVVVRNYG